MVKTSGRKFQFGFESGQLFQFGYVVENAAKGIADCSKLLGIATDSFIIQENFVAPDGTYRGRQDNPTLTIAHAFTGHIYIELIEQHTNTPSVYMEMIEKHGYGLHHFGLSIAPEDYDAVINGYYLDGFEDVFSDNLPSGARIRYIAPIDAAAREKMRNSIGVSYLECVEIVSGEEDFFCEMKRLATAV